MVRAFTKKETGLSNQLRSSVEIYVIGETAPQKNRVAIWDTGAMKTTISKEIAASLGLIPLLYVPVKTPSGKSIVPCYMVDVYLPNGSPIPRLLVLEGLLEGFDVLVGMDIINLGDFAVSNLGGKTTFTFRIPSVETIDFTKGI